MPAEGVVDGRDIGTLPVAWSPKATFPATCWPAATMGLNACWVWTLEAFEGYSASAAMAKAKRPMSLGEAMLNCREAWELGQ
jgi:hypothetical protein